MQFKDGSHFINRELSWLEFNQRVLDQATDESNPLLERLKFLCIVSSNLDEFFEVRVAGLKQQKQMHSFETGPDGLTASEALAAISARVRRMVDDQYDCWRDQLQPRLEDQHLRFHSYADVPKSEHEHLASFFTKRL